MKNYWVVGAMWAGKAENDALEEFITHGYWYCWDKNTTPSDEESQGGGNSVKSQRERFQKIDKGDRILPFEDEDVANLISESLEKQGATIHHGSSLKRMDIKNGKVEYELEYKDGKKEVLYYEDEYKNKNKTFRNLVNEYGINSNQDTLSKAKLLKIHY